MHLSNHRIYHDSVRLGCNARAHQVNDLQVLWYYVEDSKLMKLLSIRVATKDSSKNAISKTNC